MFKWRLLHQRTPWPIFLAYCGLADINQRRFICKRRRSRSICHKSTLILMWFWNQIDRRQSKENAEQHLSLYHRLKLFDFDDILRWSVLRLTLNEPNHKSKRKSTDLYVRQMPGSETHNLNRLPLPYLYESAWNIFIYVIDQTWGQH